jgi:hypothetical protein
VHSGRLVIAIPAGSQTAQAFPGLATVLDGRHASEKLFSDHADPVRL